VFAFGQESYRYRNKLIIKGNKKQAFPGAGADRKPEISRIVSRVLKLFLFISPGFR